jgi:hypothetical protein
MTRQPILRPIDMDTTENPTREQVARLRVANHGPSPTTLRMEPWGASHALVLTGPEPADIEIEVSPSEIVVYGWAGSVLDGIGLPVPESPRPRGEIGAR